MPRFRSLAAATVALAACAACGVPGSDLGPTARWPQGDALLGRWEQPEPMLPPVTLELRREGAGIVGRVALSGVTYDAPVAVTNTSFVLGAGRPAMRGALRRDGRLDVELLEAAGRVAHADVLVPAR
jgi:hypothetical protein